MGAEGSYTQFGHYLRQRSPRTIFEVGSRDGLDAIDLSQAFRCPVFAFECNPDAIALCRRNLAAAGDHQVELVELALSERDGAIDFFPFDLTRYDNLGASSMFLIDFTTNRLPSDPDYGRGAVQTHIKVSSARGDTFCRDRQIAQVDLLCMDVQGAERLVLEGFGDALRRTTWVITETAVRSTYSGGSSFREVQDYLRLFGFRYVASDAFGTRAPDPSLRGYSEFNAVFRADR
jgi:FkbM family methyltransferase